MSFSIQIIKGFAPVHCDICGNLFWNVRRKTQERIAAGKPLYCRDCQLFRGFDLPPWPCARPLDVAEREEMEKEAEHFALTNTDIVSPSSPSSPPMKISVQQNTLTLAELRKKLQYFIDVNSRGISKLFCMSAGISYPTLKKFLAGKPIGNTVRLKIVAEMEKQGWLVGEEAKKEPSIVNPEPTEKVAQHPLLTRGQRHFLILAIHNKYAEDSFKEELFKLLDL